MLGAMTAPTPPRVAITAAAAAALGEPAYVAGLHEVDPELHRRVADLLGDESLPLGKRQALAALARHLSAVPVEAAAEGAVLGTTEPSAPVVPPKAPSSPKAKGRTSPANVGGDPVVMEGATYVMHEVPASELVAGDAIASRGSDGSVVTVMRVERVTAGSGSVFLEGTAVVGRRRGRMAERMAPTTAVLRLAATE